MLANMMICVGVKELKKNSDFAFFFVKETANFKMKKSNRQYCFRFNIESNLNTHEKRVLLHIVKDILQKEKVCWEDINIKNLSKMIGRSCCIHYFTKRHTQWYFSEELKDKKIVKMIEVFGPFNEVEGE